MHLTERKWARARRMTAPIQYDRVPRLHAIPIPLSSPALRTVKKILGACALLCSIPLGFAALTLHWLIIPAVGLLSTGLYWFGHGSEY